MSSLSIEKFLLKIGLFCLISWAKICGLTRSINDNIIFYVTDEVFIPQNMYLLQYLSIWKHCSALATKPLIYLAIRRDRLVSFWTEKKRPNLVIYPYQKGPQSIIFQIYRFISISGHIWNFEKKKWLTLFLSTIFKI